MPVEYFKRVSMLTKDAGLVMGRNTWDALNEEVLAIITSATRVIVLTTRPTFTNKPNVVFATPKTLDTILQPFSDVFVLGGESIYAMFIGRAQRIYASIEDAAPPSTSLSTFLMNHLQDFEIVHYSDAKHVIYERCSPSRMHGEYVYLNLLGDIYNTGKIREDRTKVGTVSVFGRQMRFDISKSVPLLTTKQLGWKSVVRELLWFIKGQTDSKLLEAHKVNIWKENTTREFLEKRGLTEYQEGDIGPMYGFQWRHMGAEYKGANHDYSNKGHDQIKWLLDSLRTDPYSRRHMITTFNPVVVDKGVLAPCHGIVAQFYVEDAIQGGPKYLSCHVYNRSQDTFLGMSWNIFSYAVLTYIIAKFVNMRPKELVMSTGDTHIYSNHLEQCKVQMARTPFPFPVLTIKDTVISKPNGIDDLTIDDFDLVGYVSHPALKAPMAV